MNASALEDEARSLGVFVARRPFRSLADGATHDSIIVAVNDATWAVYRYETALLVEEAIADEDAGYVPRLPMRMTLASDAESVVAPMRTLLASPELDSYPPGHGHLPLRAPSWVIVFDEE